MGVKARGKGKSGLLSTVVEIDSDRGENFCLLDQCCSDLICSYWEEGRPQRQWRRLHCQHFSLGGPTLSGCGRKKKRGKSDGTEISH